MTALPKRCARFGLTIHPQKTTLVAFGKPSARVAEDLREFCSSLVERGLIEVEPAT